MIYGLGTRAFIEDGPVDLAARADSLRSTARAWRALDEARRLALVERAMSVANDSDCLPIAL